MPTKNEIKAAVQSALKEFHEERRKRIALKHDLLISIIGCVGYLLVLLLVFTAGYSLISAYLQFFESPTIVASAPASNGVLFVSTMIIISIILLVFVANWCIINSGLMFNLILEDAKKIKENGGWNGRDP